jgi:hypothetical protein
MKSSILTLVMVGIVTAAPHSVAQPATESSAARSSDGEAARRFQRGVSLYREGSFDAALAEFSRAYEIKPDYRVLYNIAEVQSELGDYVAAVASFRKYLREGASGVPKQRRSEVEDEIDRLNGRVAKLEIEGNVDDAELLVDGKTVGKLPLEKIAVNAGVRHIVVKKTGFRTTEKELTLTGGETSKLQLSLEPEIAPAATPAPSRQQAASEAPMKVESHEMPPPSRPNPGLWISLIATGVAAGATVTAGLITKSAKDDYNDKLQRFPGSVSDINDARDATKRDALITDICGAVTIVGIGATIYFAVTGGKRRPVESHVGEVHLSTGPAGAGWQVQGTF